jgi:hypothetical protein
MLKKTVFFLLIICSFLSCKKDFFSESGAGLLSFSNDSVVFDTVFVSVGSITKTLTVYNNNNNPVTVNNIRLSNISSLGVYRINVDGFPIENSSEIKIAPNDSIFVFIEATINPGSSNSPFLISDSLVFSTNGTEQQVKLVAYGQNAHFYTPVNFVQFTDDDGDTTNIRYFSVSSNTTWTNDKPHVIYGYVIVEEGVTLTIEQGTQIHFHQNSGLIAGNPLFFDNNGGTIIVNGEKDNEVVFQGDRLDDYYQDAPGQWDRIWLSPGSKNNVFNYAIIKDATVGIQSDTLGSSSEPTLRISNSIIDNASTIGLYGNGSHVEGFNNLVSNCGEYAVVLNIGGSYDFQHCTFANYYSYFSRATPTLLINNFYEDIFGVTQARDLIQANFSNCIISGSLIGELALVNNEQASFNYLFDHCLLKLDPDSSLANLNQVGSAKINQGDLLFTDAFNNDFTLIGSSIAIDAGSDQIGILNDLNDNTRDDSPDIGAYEY